MIIYVSECKKRTNQIWDIIHCGISGYAWNCYPKTLGHVLLSSVYSVKIKRTFNETHSVGEQEEDNSGECIKKSSLFYPFPFAKWSVDVGKLSKNSENPSTTGPNDDPICYNDITIQKSP